MLGRGRQDWQNQTATAALAGYAEALELIFSNAAGLNLDSPASTTRSNQSLDGPWVSLDTQGLFFGGGLRGLLTTS